MLLLVLYCVATLIAQRLKKIATTHIKSLSFARRVHRYRGSSFFLIIPLDGICGWDELERIVRKIDLQNCILW